MANIKDGGQLMMIFALSEGGKPEDVKVETISATAGGDRTINLYINQRSLSYLTIEEALDIRDELNKAIAIVTGLNDNE
jgi:hypothetical protein